jgi:serine/threonine-protein kinase
VWVADHLALNTHVAVKLIDPELAKREDARERFKREATAAAQLRSAHVVQILDHGIDEGNPFIVMELLEGEDLFERLDKRGRLSLRETSKIITQVCRALARAHAAGIVHRDLKPENVFLCNNEDEEIVKVLDFGVAKVTDPAKSTMQKTGIGTLIGTPHYMSPEQVKGTSEVDSRTDLWAIGVIAYQCVVGELPFDSEGVGDLLIKISIADPPTPSKVFPGVSSVFDVWFAKACERDRTKRFQSARELAEALARVVASVPEAMRGAPPPRPTSVRPPPVAAPGPSSVRGTKPGLNPAPQAPPSIPRPPVLPVSVPTVSIAARIVEAAPEPIGEQEIDDFDFDFDEELEVVTTTEPQPSAALTGVVQQVSTPLDSTTSTSVAVGAPSPTAGPPPRPSTSGVAHALSSPPATPLLEQLPQGRAPSTSLGAPVLQPGMLGPAPPIVPSPVVHKSAVSPTTSLGIASGDRLSPPPELDGSRRSKTLGFVILLFVLAVGGVAFVVVQSNMMPPEPIAAPSASVVSMPDLPPVVIVPDPSAGFAAPSTSKPLPPKYTGKPWPGNKSKSVKPGTSSDVTPKPTTDKPPGDIVIEVPTPPAEDDSVPPAP